MALSRLMLSSLLSAVCISIVTAFNVAAFISSPPKIFVRPLEKKRSPKSTKLYQVYLEDDLVSVDIGGSPKLFVVRSDSTVSPLCTHEDDNLTDLYVDPREEDNIEIDDKDVLQCYGEGWYSQRVVPSLGGGPGYGASAKTLDLDHDSSFSTFESFSSHISIKRIEGSIFSPISMDDSSSEGSTAFEFRKDVIPATPKEKDSGINNASKPLRVSLRFNPSGEMITDENAAPKRATASKTGLSVGSSSFEILICRISKKNEMKDASKMKDVVSLKSKLNVTTERG
eukprot:171422_1